MRGACGEGAHQQSPVSAQAVARGAARCASQEFDPGIQAAARGAARFAPQVPDRGAKAVALWCVVGA